MMASVASHPLAALEPRLRNLLPADLYAAAWLDPDRETLVRVFEHLRTLQRILYDYVPRQVSERRPSPGEISHDWQHGTLMFTDLAGFTPLMEINARLGTDGARSLLLVLNNYFARMIEIVSMSGGTLLEFTGDAMLAQFSADNRLNDTAQAVRAGLRMQRAMEQFGHIATPQGEVSLGMRIGIHSGRYLTANIGTPHRMDHVLLGGDVRTTKHAEGSGYKGRVCLTDAAYERVRAMFRFDDGEPGYQLVVDDLEVDELGEYDVAFTRRRLASAMLFDRSEAGVLREIGGALEIVEPLASYLPTPILKLLVESAAQREITPKFPNVAVIFVNLLGLTEASDRAHGGQEEALIAEFSRAFTLINAAVEARGGVLKKVTCHLDGSDTMVYFGVPNAHGDDAMRAAGAALAIREIVNSMPPFTVGGQEMTLSCQIGISYGPVFAGEIGEPRGRREYNVLGDTVNTAARLMSSAALDQVLVNEAVKRQVETVYRCESLGEVELKGKSGSLPIYALSAGEAEA
ncbi:MAG: adenylate/guanylate cyclase domain-containing protein [Anaerolineae bacterium]|nr:adenylate/guanylate cyclase domain-containing protein [Anaerolineae bacterium]